MYEYDIFLAYAREDQPAVRKLARDLKEQGFRIWLDEEQIRVGDSIVAGIAKGLDRSRFLGVCISRNLKRSRWVRSEYSSVLHREFLSGETRVLPLLIGDFEESDLPPLLLDKKRCDLRNGRELDRLVHKLRETRSQYAQAPKLEASPSQRATPARPDPEGWSQVGISPLVQLWFPHPIARSYFHFLRSDGPDRASCGRVVLDRIVRCLNIYLLAELRAMEREKPTEIASLEGSPPQLLHELAIRLFRTSRTAYSALFIPELLEWVLAPDGSPSRHLSELQRAWAHDVSRELPPGWRSWMDETLASLRWLVRYPLVSVERPAGLRGEPSTAYRILIGSIQGFIEQRVHGAEAVRIPSSRTCFLLSPDGRALLCLDPLIRFHPETGVWLWKRRTHRAGVEDVLEDLQPGPVASPFESAQASEVLQVTGLIHLGTVLRFKESPFERLPRSPEQQPAGPLHTSGSVSARSGQDLYDELGNLESELLQLPREPGSLEDSGLLVLDRVARELCTAARRDDLSALVRQRIEGIFFWWQNYVGSRDPDRLDASIGQLLHERRLSVSGQLLRQDLADSWDADLALSAGLSDGGTGGRYSLGRPPTPEELAEMLVGSDPLDQDEALHFLLLGDPESRSRKIERVVACAPVDELNQAVWERAPRIWLSDRRAFWELVGHLLPTAEDLWKRRIHNLRYISSASLRTTKAQGLLEEVHEVDKLVLCQFLALHPSARCRTLGLEMLPLEAFWDLIVAPGTRLMILEEVVGICCQKAPDPYIKALFLLCWQRMVEADTPLDLASAYEAMMHFYGRPLFLEDTFFRALLDLHKKLSSLAQKHDSTRVLEQRYSEVFLGFAKRHPIRDNEIAHMRHVPLPIQRLLAHRGHFPEVFICNIRDIIALETVPHVSIRDDAFRFLRIKRINRVALEQLGKDKRLMREHRNRVAYCHNPKAKPFFVKQFVPYLRRQELRALIEDRGAGTYCRKIAERHLSRSSR